MRLFSSTALISFLTSFAVFGMPQAAFARERGPRVEVVCPSPPIAVKLAEHKVLAYELHITNFDIEPLTLKRLEVFADVGGKQPLKVISDEALSAVMVEAGSMGGAKDSQIIGPAKRAVVFVWIELRLDARLPGSLRHRMIFAAGAAGEAKAGATAESTLEDFQVPVSQDAAPLLNSPFDGGVWLAGDGLANDSVHRRAVTAIDGYIHNAQRFAIDWVKVGPNGDSHHDGTTRNENWWGYGEPIRAVADGEVTQVLDGIPENVPRVLPKEVTLDSIAGNYVILRIAPNRYVTYAHLQSGSIGVRLHDHVARGRVIGRLGNSGQATAPHLHLQVTDGNSVLQSEGVPFIFSSFTDLGPGSDYELNKHLSVPRTDSVPGKDEVVELPVIKKQ
jgi:murein DD-endopeptidase MepM/ murein hydrolase activator NlpD